jgi:rhamnogalacturonyl hydrolase YesR
MKHSSLFLLLWGSLAFAVLHASDPALSINSESRTVTADQIIADGEVVADAQLKALGGKVGTDWIWATMYAGYAEFAAVSKRGAEYIDAAMAMGKKCAWTPPLDPKAPFHADNLAIGQTILDLHAINPNAVPLDPLKSRVDSLIAELNAKAGDPNHLTWWWCDALFMAPSVLARLSEVTGDPKYLDAMDKEWDKVAALLYDKEENLYIRDKRYIGSKTKNGKKVFWARGNGWVAMGLARVLQAMPRDYPARSKYEAVFRDLMAKIASVQSQDGSWRTSLIDPDEYPNSEASGTAFFNYAMAWGINHGYLEREKYLPVVAKAWSALLAMRRADGQLGYVQSVDDKPGQSFANGTQLYASGGFLLAALELQKLAPFELPPSPKLRESVPKQPSVPSATQAPSAEGIAARAYAVQVMTRLADPVLLSLSDNKLKEWLPVFHPQNTPTAPLEALGRLLAGMAPWLELGPGDDAEGKLRAHYIELAVKGIGIAVDPQSPDFMNFTTRGQPLVDSAFLAQALLRAPKQLWGNLAEKERSNLCAALKTALHKTHPDGNNWVLFGATIAAALWEFTGECEIAPMELAINRHMEWYKGDGVYGDGATFHWDYYNSYVIQPMLLDVLRVCQEKNHPLAKDYDLILKRAERYAAIQERLISPEGTFPVMGRSSCYRFGAFQTLSQIALMHKLPESIQPSAVRAGLGAVIRRMIEAPGTFDEKGWLRPGAVGFQPSLAEAYISTGSLYLCTVGLLQLGLPANDPFWTAPDAPWTQQRIWSGQDLPADHAVNY